MKRVCFAPGEGESERLIKYYIQNYSNRVLHGYGSIFIYLQSFRKTDACIFCIILCKFFHFLYFATTDVIALYCTRIKERYRE